jgi:Ca2+-binding EF-hand superfamily protein
MSTNFGGSNSLILNGSGLQAILNSAGINESEAAQGGCGGAKGGGGRKMNMNALAKFARALLGGDKEGQGAASLNGANSNGAANGNFKFSLNLDNVLKSAGNQADPVKGESKSTTGQTPAQCAEECKADSAEKEGSAVDKAFDEAGKDGAVSLQEFKDIAQKNGMSPDEAKKAAKDWMKRQEEKSKDKALDDAFKSIDGDGNGKLDSKDKDLGDAKESQSRQLANAFDSLDDNKDAELNSEDLKKSQASQAPVLSGQNLKNFVMDNIRSDGSDTDKTNETEVQTSPNEIQMNQNATVRGNSKNTMQFNFSLR